MTLWRTLYLALIGAVVCWGALYLSGVKILYGRETLQSDRQALYAATCHYIDAVGIATKRHFLPSGQALDDFSCARVIRE